MSHKCSFCASTFRKSKHRFQHEETKHPKQIEARERMRPYNTGRSYSYGFNPFEIDLSYYDPFPGLPTRTR